MKIIHKMMLAPGVAMVFLIALAVVAQVSLSRQNQRMLSLDEVTISGVNRVSAQTVALGDVHTGIYSKMGIMASLDEAGVKRVINKAERDIDAIGAEFGKMKNDPVLQRLATQAAPVLARYRKSVIDAVDMAAMDPNTGIASMQTASEVHEQLRVLLTKSARELDSQANRSLQQGQQTYRTMLWVTGITLSLSLLVLGCITVTTARSVTRPLQHVIDTAQAVAAGRLDVSFYHRASDEIGLLFAALEEMKGKLIRVVAAVRAGTQDIAQASSELADGNHDLALRTATEVHSIKETTASISSLTATVRQNAAHANQASALATRASATAELGGSVVGQVVSTMGAINDSSKRIVDIIAVIDGIAFQTNILALNAAVEAARAGEQGRGFAVVASEVRSLAQRSATAAQEIKQLIGASVERVDQGTLLVDRAGSTMQELVASIKGVSAIMSDITLASEAQSNGIAQVSRAIGEMNEVAAQNATLVQKAAASTDAMQRRAEHMVDVVSSFELGDQGAAGNGSSTRAPAGGPATRSSRLKLG